MHIYIYTYNIYIMILQVKICKNIGYCHFLQNEITVNGVTKQLVNVHMVVEAGGHFETNIDYVLKYW